MNNKEKILKERKIKTLWDKRCLRPSCDIIGDTIDWKFYGKDVKQFIKEIKYALGNDRLNNELIDKLAGEELL